MTRLIRIMSLAVLLSTPGVGEINVSAGTRLRVQLQTEVDTKTSRVGDVVQALVVELVHDGNLIVVPVGARLTGHVTAVSPQNKANETHALLRLSFDELVLPNGQRIKTQAVIQSLGHGEDVGVDGTATIHPFSHDFALKSGRNLWLRITSSSAPLPEVAVDAQSSGQQQASAPSTQRDTSEAAGRLGDLLITLDDMEHRPPQFQTEPDRYAVLIVGTVRNVGKSPVCTSLNAKLETSFRLDEFVTISLAHHTGGIIRELLPGEQLDASFAASLKNGTDPLKVKISQSQPEQGCGSNSHIVFRTDVTIPVNNLPQAGDSKEASNKTTGVIQLGARVSPPRLKHQTEPDFTKEARNGGHEGRVVVRATVGADGRVHDAHVVQSLGWGLDEKALEAVNQWRFEPAIKDGQKVAVYVDIEVNFRLR